MSDIKSYIEDLFRYLDTYERNYADFQIDGFVQTYNGIYAVFQALRQQRDQAMEVDHYFLRRIKAAPVTSSDLRQLTLQLLISYFESEADVDGRSNQAYAYCRGLRAAKRDIPFLENHLLPLLFSEGSLNGSLKLNSFFLDEMARFMQRFGSPVQADLSPEAFARMKAPLKFLELARRRLELGTELVKDRTSLEFHLRQVEAFIKLAATGKLYDTYLREWDYLVITSFWSRVKLGFGEFWSKVRGAFSSWRYFRLVLVQRNPAYLVYSLIMIIMVVAAIMVPRWWSDYSDNKLEEFSDRFDRVHTTSGR